jgi:hypothetical protein
MGWTPVAWPDRPTNEASGRPTHRSPTYPESAPVRIPSLAMKAMTDATWQAAESRVSPVAPRTHLRDSWVIRRPTVLTVSSGRVGTVSRRGESTSSNQQGVGMKNHLGVDPRLPGVRIDIVPEPRVAANDANGEAVRLALIANFAARYPDRFVGTEAIVSGCTLIGLWFVACIVFATCFDAGLVA